MACRGKPGMPLHTGPRGPPQTIDSRTHVLYNRATLASNSRRGRPSIQAEGPSQSPSRPDPSRFPLTSASSPREPETHSYRPNPRESIRAIGEASAGYPADLSLLLGSELSARLRLAAFIRRWAPEVLAARLLARGLDQEPDRVRAEAAIGILTPRERDMTRLTVLGLTNHEIAYKLGISSETVKSHVRSTLAKLGLHSKAELRLLVQALDPWDEEPEG